MPEVERYLPGDHDAIAALYEASFRRLVKDEDWAQSRANLERYLTDTWVVREGGRLIAFGSLEPHRPASEHDSLRFLLRWRRAPELDDLYLAAVLQHRGGDHPRPEITHHPIPEDTDWWALQHGAIVLTALAVDPAHRRRGLGTALVRTRIDEAARRGATALFVHATLGTGVEALYEREGFVPILSLSSYYLDGTGMTLMGRALCEPRDAVDRYPETPRTALPYLPQLWVLQVGGVVGMAATIAIAIEKAAASSLLAAVLGTTALFTTAVTGQQWLREQPRTWLLYDDTLAESRDGVVVDRLPFDGEARVSQEGGSLLSIRREGVVRRLGPFAAPVWVDLINELYVRSRNPITRTDRVYERFPRSIAIGVAIVAVWAAWWLGPGGALLVLGVDCLFRVTPLRASDVSPAPLVAGIGLTIALFAAALRLLL